MNSHRKLEKNHLNWFSLVKKSAFPRMLLVRRNRPLVEQSMTTGGDSHTHGAWGAAAERPHSCPDSSRRQSKQGGLDPARQNHPFSSGPAPSTSLQKRAALSEETPWDSGWRRELLGGDSHQPDCEMPTHTTFISMQLLQGGYRLRSKHVSK